MEISKFYEKLNKIEGNIYVIEEKAGLTGGVYDAPLQHDNINTSTLSVYTGPKLTGERIQTYVLSTPSLTPWKRTIRVYADVPTVYISYEAEGDTVEAEDVNQLQEEVVRTQEAINEEISRAKAAEQTLSENLTIEINRSKGAEQTIAGNLTAEISRAKEAERANADNLVTETTRALAAEESIRSTIQSNKPIWDDKYTRNEVDNKFATLENDIDWKETVNTYADIAVAYPNPQDGWTVNVKNTDYTYRYSGTEWVVISANAIPKATQSVDGLLSKEDKTLYDDANSKKHTHGNKTTIDKITETLLSRWNEAFDKRHEHGNKGILDMITQALLDNWSAAFTHVSDAVKHITAAERTDWNDANSKKHTHSNKSVIDGITQILIDRWNAAEMNVQADWNVADTTSDAFIKNKPSSLPANGGSASMLSNAVQIADYNTFVPAKVAAGAITPIKANADANSPWNNTTSGLLVQSNSADSWHLLIFRSGGDGWAYRSYYQSVWKDWKIWSTFDGKYSSLTEKPTSFPPSTHSHTKSQITDMPSKVSEFANDAGYITSAEVGPGYTHPNSGVTAGTYRSVTVNTQGHVTSGTNPTTLAGYGITDAAAKTHNHDSAYLKKTGLTWDDLKGVL